MQTFLPVKTERLVLRAFERNDLEALAAYYQLPEIQRYLNIRARDKAECRHALESFCGQVTLNRPGDCLTVAIERQEDGVLVGHLALLWYDATAAQGELRFVIDPQFRRQGYASEATRAALDLAFDKFRLHRVFARCDARNQASARMLKKLGMRLEAHYREHALFQGEWDEELHFAILNREWRRSSKVRELTHLVA